MHAFSLWINDIRTNGYRVVIEDDKGNLVTHKYFGTFENPNALKQAKAEQKAFAKANPSVSCEVEPHEIVLGNIDELDSSLGSLRVNLDAFHEAGFEPEKHQLFAINCSDVYFNTDENDERVGDYLHADDFSVSGMKELKKYAKTSVLS